MADIPDYRKGRLVHIAEALGLSADAAAMRARMSDNLEFSEDFIQPIQARLNEELAKTAVREAEAAAALNQ